tara:strand:- start:5522 stop:5923 length:402 start_codon:yes stop_codon:yes gene_type:complete
MGTKIKAKFDGGCKICGESWNVGDEICYQKTPKAICQDVECFSQQGGILGTPKAFGNPANIIITKVPEVQISEDTKIIGGLWEQYFKEAHELTKKVYPQEDVNSDRFGMIRQTVLNQLVHLAGVVVAKRNQDD